LRSGELKIYLIATELGLVLLGDGNSPISHLAFPEGERAREYIEADSGSLDKAGVEWLTGSLETAKKSNEPPEAQIHLYAQPALVSAVSSATALPVEPIPQEQSREFTKNKVELLASSGLAENADQAQELLRKVSLEVSSLKLRELSAKPDLQAMESVQALDEVDKSSNMLSARVREWYGLHFPELVSWIGDNASLMKLILKFRTRENYDAEELEKMGYSKNKSKAIEDAAKQSRGADIREEDILRIAQLANEAEHLFTLRDKLATHVDNTMRQVAPNVTDIAGATIGARLIARAGGLRKLAILPASTIQILGAEKALYRALKSGSRPPKHGILFQHEAVHSAPKWQRGKIARSVAGKIAIAARIDSFRGSRDESISHALELRLNEIKEKYKEAPKESKTKSVSRPELRRNREFRPGRDRNRRGTRKFREERAGPPIMTGRNGKNRDRTR
jgi:nucleolar protein 56